MTIVPLAPDLEVCHLLNRAFRGLYPFDLPLLQHNTSDHPSFEPDGLLGACLEGSLRGVALLRPGHLDLLAVDPDFQGQGLGRALLEAALLRLGPGPIRVGGGPAHFFPGVPQEFSACETMFERRGFRPDWTALDLRVQQPLAEPDERIGPCRDPAALVEFLERDFPGRWLADTRRRLERGDDPANVLVAVRQRRVIAFCHLFHPEARMLGPSVFWRGLLEFPWGGLGPVGVAADSRGSGLGIGLVRTALHELARRGVVDVVVDWTGVPEFYARAGFVPFKRYRSWLRPQEG